jgi:hypothetical protein
LKLILIAEIIVLIGSALAISRDYQDSWILEGLEIPFVLFVATYALAFFSEKRVSLMVALAVVGRFVFLLIPNLKYVWFEGTAIDQHMQYGLANHVYNEGYIATQGPFGVSVYGSTPLIHLTFAIFSIVLNMPVVDSVKYLPVFLSPLYPLLTYVIMKNLKFLQGTAALKYALFLSSIPISPEKYVVTGAQFGVLLTFLVFSTLVILLQKNDRRYWSVFIFLILVLAATHSSSSVLLTTFVLITMLLQKIFNYRLKSYLKASTVFALTLICGAWLMFPAGFTFEAIVRTILVGVPSGTSPGGYVPPRFFELAYIDMLGAIKTILVFNGADAFLLLLTISGLMVMLKMRKQVDSTSKFLFIISGFMLLFIPIGFLLKVGGFRVLHLASPLFPIFSGIFILYISKRRAWMRAVIFSSIILLATLQLYSCQPLIPSANILSKDLPTSEPIVYVTSVNSIYQRQMIEFARDHVGGQIASDIVTRNQITGLTEFDFSVAHLAWYYPLDKNQPRRKYDCFLIHLPGASGAFEEQAEIRTRDLIIEVIYNSSIIYTNGESYILAHKSAYP